MKPFYKITFAICFLQCLLSLNAHATATVYDWTGAAGDNLWITPGNWKVGATTQTINYPGKSLNTDIAQIGVNYSFSYQPTVSSAISIGYLYIGTKTASVTLTINAALTVNSDFIQKNDGSGAGVTTSIAGSGSMYCANFYLGDSTPPPTPIVGLADVTYKTTLNFSLSGLTVGQNLLLTTTSTSAVINVFQSANVNNPVFNLNSGWVSVGNVIQTVDNSDVNLPGFTFLVVNYAPISSSAQFLMNPASGNSSILYLNGPSPLSLDGNAGYVDFYGTAGGTSQVNYSGSVNQEVYTTSSAYNAAGTRQYANGLDRSPSIYQDLVLSGSQVKKADANNLTVGGNFTLSVSSTATADFSTNSPAVVIGGIYTANIGTTLNLGGTGTMSVGCGICTSTNAGTLNQSSSGNITFSGPLSNQSTGVISQSGSGAINLSSYLTNAGSYTQTSGSTGGMSITGNLTNSGTITQTAGNLSVGGGLTNSSTLTLGSANLTIGGNYNNTGSYTQSTGTTLFNGSAAQTLQDASNSGTTFNKVSFSGAGAKTISSGAFSVSSTGILTMIGSNSALSCGGYLTLKSDATGSAAVAAVPSGATISGLVNVERYIPGGSVSQRSYMLLSSPVYAATTAAKGPVYSINYLKNNTFLTGTDGVAGGFDNTGGGVNNPTLYLFRENFSGVYGSFTSTNYRGIKNIAQTPAYNYLIDIDGGPYNIPIGNGFLFFFRGSRSTTTPFTPGTVPLATTLSTSGTLNVGPVAVQLWFTAAGSPYLSYTPSTVFAGYNLVGNPYPCAIDWDTYTTTNNGTGIYGSGLTGAIWVVDPVSKKYGSYNAGVASAPFVSHIVASGQGFFVQANAASPQLIFNESAKTTSQVTGSQLLMSEKSLLPPAKPQAQYFRLQLGNDSLTSEYTAIRMVARSPLLDTASLNAAYVPGSTLTKLSSLATGAKYLSINVVSFPGKKDRRVVPLDVNAYSTGTYELRLSSIVAIPELYDIWLADAYKKDSVNLRKTGVYRLEINKADSASFGSKRFTVVIRQDTAFSYRLLEFTASKISQTRPCVEVTWRTSNEGNYTNFTVERSQDGGATYVILGGVSSTGAGEYSFRDKSPTSGTNLYRLKQEDNDNAISYSKVVTLEYAATGGLAYSNLDVYPNPSRGIVNLNILSQNADNDLYTIRFVNSTGLIVKEVITAQAQWQGNINAFLPGTYVVRVINTKSQSFVGEAKLIKL